MSWLFSQALVEAFSGASSSDGEPCAPLSVMPTPHKFWRNDKMMEPSKLSQFGLTCAVLTEDRGAELLTSFLEASRARTSAYLGGGAGLSGKRSGLWREMARIIGEVRPRFVLVENSPALTSRGLGTVLGDLASLGMDAEWGIIGAHNASAPHRRNRIWILAYSARLRWSERGTEQPGKQGRPSPLRGGPQVANTESQGLPHGEQARIPQSTGSANGRGSQPRPERCGCSWWATEPALVRVVHGLAHRVDRIKALGNGQVPAVVELAWETLMRRVNEN